MEVKQYDPACGQSPTASLVVRLNQAALVWARSRWASFHLDQELALVSTSDPDRVSKLAGWLLEAVPRLPLRQRQAVIGWFYESRSVEEIAGWLGVCPATVRSLLRHGVDALRQLRGSTEGQ
jgi:DNA-directed RNA polymerase specialized sigma24 family protein